MGKPNLPLFTNQLVMEYCSKGSVGNYLRNVQKLKEVEIRDIAACSLLGLNDLHKQRIIHRVIHSSLLLGIGHQARQSPLR